MHKTLWTIAVIAIAASAYYWYSLMPKSGFSLDSADRIASWELPATHKDDGPLEKGVNEEIARLNEHLEDDKTEPPDYQLYVGLANQYSLLGDGKRAYDYLQKALALDSDKTGLALHNMGILLERLGAYESAREALQQAVDVQPHIDAYHAALIRFLMAHYGEDALAVSAALDRAAAQFDDDTFVLQLKAEWQTARGAYTDAIATWEELKKTAPQDLVPAIESEIAKLRGKL